MRMIAPAGGLVLLASLMLVGLPQAQGATTQDTPAIGANSFTEAQAKAWLEEAGYTKVANLVLGSDGVWRASARLRGIPTLVCLDYQGNVVEL